MDSAHFWPSSPTSTSTNAHATEHMRSSTSPPPPAMRHSKRYSEPGTTRQRRLLQSRNAKFPAKKLSLSNLGSRFSQLIHANDESQVVAAERDQENTPLMRCESSIRLKRHSPTRSLGILDEISYSNRKSSQSGNFSIHQDTPERPLLERSPYTSPAAFQDSLGQNHSPIEFDRLQDNLGSMRLREISGNEHRGSFLATSPSNGSIKALKKRRSIQIKAGYDTQEYIDHIEQELQRARNEMYSPNTNKSLKDQLDASRHENVRLIRDMTDMRDLYEAEVKRGIENKTQMEVELRRRVRDLEEELEDKTATIRDLELQYEEKRLDSNTIENLKAAIERLELLKISLEDENRSMNKRNEVLSELLAMSPTKMQTFELRSPVREKRGPGRPMSMIIPRPPLSPNGRLMSQPSSAIASPALSASGSFFRNWRSRPGSPRQDALGLEINDGDSLDALRLDAKLIGHSQGQRRASGGGRSRRSTLQSQCSFDTASFVSDTSLPTDIAAQRVPPKRKPRKFMSGSTQLKPLLLPTLTGEMGLLSTPSVPYSPSHEVLYDDSQESIDPTTYFISQLDDARSEAMTLSSTEVNARDMSDSYNHNSAEACCTFEEVLAEHDASIATGTLIEEQSHADHSSTLSTYIGADFEPQGRHHSFTDLNDSVCSGNNLPLEQAEDEALSSWSRHLLKSVHMSQGIPDPAGVDLRALSRLELPEPQYDVLPRSHPGIDENIPTDVPRPLFSLHECSEKLKSSTGTMTVLTQQPQDSFIHNPTNFQKTDRSNLAMCNFQSSPTLKGRSSWHASTDASKKSNLDQATESVSSRTSDLPQRLSRRSEYLTGARSPLELIQSSRLGAKPLASLTIRTIFGTISQCTGHVRDFRRDPLALARRVIANAWLSNWARFGKLSWWVLGLFITKRASSPKITEWDWTSYDAEEIAQRAYEQDEYEAVDTEASRSGSHLHAGQSHETFDETSLSTSQKPGWGGSLMLWGKFSVAIMLAVGGAVVKGPGEMLKEIEQPKQKRNGESSLPHAGRRDPDGGTPTFSLGLETSGEIDTGGRSSRRQHGARLTSTPPPGTIASASACCPSFSSAADDHGNPSWHHSQTSIREDEDATLRAVAGPRIRVTDLFLRQRGSTSDRGESSNTRSFHSRFQSLENLDDGTLWWPPSPGPIRPEGNHSQV